MKNKGKKTMKDFFYPELMLIRSAAIIIKKPSHFIETVFLQNT